MANLRLARSRLVVLAALALAGALALSACSSGSGAAAPSGTGIFRVSGGTSTTGFAGTVLSTPVTLTAADTNDTFEASTGSTTTLGRLGSGKLMLLYFGYTHCPDVCPTTMADLAQALQNSSAPVQARTQVVFVTSDPARDTAPVLKSWLARAAPGTLNPAVGLTSSIKQIDTVAKSVGVPLEPPVTNPDGSVTVQHGAQVLAFLNGKASLVWLAGATPDDYTRDMNKLLTQGEPT